jgi:hypothetical protein
MVQLPEGDSLERLKRELYSRNPERRPRMVRRARERTDDAKTPDDRPLGWSYNPPPIVSPPPKKSTNTKRPSALSLFLFAALGVLVMTILFVGYRLFFAPPAISPQNVEITVDAPTTARAGDLVRVAVRIQNNNAVDLLDTRLVVSFPENALAADGSGAEAREVERPLGVLASGGTIEEEVSAFLFGNENDELEIGIAFDYGTEGSSARLSNTATHTVSMSTSPVLVTVTPSVREVQSGNEFQLEVNVASNTALRLDDIVVEITYPRGFNFISSEPEPIVGNTTWRLGDLEPEASKKVVVRGHLEGESNEDRFFAVRVGREGEGAIGRLFASVQERMTIVAPPIALSTRINGSSEEVASSFSGGEVSVNINWSNTLRAPLTNLIIEAHLDDEFIQDGSVRVANGFYKSGEDVIVWNRSTEGRFGEIGALGSGSVSFSFKVADMRQIGSVANPNIPISIYARASAPQRALGARVIENRLERTVRIASNLAVSQTLSPAGGEHPPVAELETLYTVFWTAGNFGNRVNNVSVRAALPVYVTFKHTDDPNVRFNRLTNEVIWTIGDMDEGAERAPNLRTSFEISFVPSRDHVHRENILVHRALMEGRDAFTGSILRSTAEALNSARVSR